MSLLQYNTRGEIEKLEKSQLLNAERKTAFDEICAEINKVIHTAQQAQTVDNSVFNDISQMLREITASMVKEADNLKEYGGAVRFIATEFENFAGRTGDM